MKNLKETRFKAGQRRDMIILVSSLFVLAWTSAAPGQMGMGDSKGIARQRLKPHLVRLSGKLHQISTHPCENTTGKAEFGTHLIIKDKNGRELNIHLGPASDVSEIVKRLTVGNEFELIGFRTDKMSLNHYVAKTLILPNHIIHLRDSTLSPFWSFHRFSRQDPLISRSTIKEKRSIETTNSFLSHPKYCWRRCFQDRLSPGWRRCCRGRACGRRWK
jgi:hypothetical protein